MNLLNNKNEKWFWLAALAALVLIGYTGLASVGYILTLALMIFAFLNPKQGILMLFVYIPVRVFIVEYNPGLRFISDAIIFGALLKVFWMNRTSIKSLFQFKLFEYAFFSFLIIGAISAVIMGIDPINIVQQVRSFILFYLVYYIVYRLEVTRKDLVNLVWIFVWTSILLIIQAIVEKLSIRNAFVAVLSTALIPCSD